MFNCRFDVVDVGFQVRYAVKAEAVSDASNVYALNHGMKLNLTMILKDFARKSISAGLTWIDMSSDTKSNPVSLTMVDVLSLPTTNGVYQLMLTGVAIDKLVLTEGEWTDTHDSTAQSLID